MRALPRLALVACLFLAASTARAGEPVAPIAPPDLTGKWAGNWESDSNGHRGPLRATFRKLDDAHYRVVFRGRFFKVIPFRYAVTLDVVGTQADRVFLSGSSRLPLVGTFSYSAEATHADFVATFQSGNDHGKFVLRRCGAR